MKKFLVLAIAVLGFTTANAQESLTPKKGSFSAEVQFNPFSNDFKSFALSGDNKATLKGRYFFNEKNALRFSIGLNANQTKVGPTLVSPERDLYPTIETYNAAVSVYDLSKKNKATNKNGSFSIGVGYERHWAVAKRVDLYAGAELALGFNWASSKVLENEATLNTDGTIKEQWENKASVSNANAEYVGQDLTLTPAAYFNFGANIFTGIDFYVYKGLYVGTEFGLALANRSQMNYKTKVETGNPNAEVKSKEVKYETSDNQFVAKFHIIPALRLGWTF